MFGPPGRAYVYLVYGMYDCLNVVSGPDGEASAVLLRAVEPLEGEAAMVAAHRRRWAGRGRVAAGRPEPRLASGPGLLCAAFDIDRSLTGTDLCDPGAALRLESAAAGDRPTLPAWTARMGVAYAGEPWASLRWRLVDRGSPALSARVPSDTTANPDPYPGPGG